MRTIKFRAWDGKKMHVSPPGGNQGPTIQTQSSPISLNDTISLMGKYWALMQFTGLLDKNGKEIYEGDIVKCYQAQGLGFVTGIVHFGIEDRSGWPDPRIYLDTRPFQEHNGSEFSIFHKSPEVIGNIYENPDLISKE